METPIAHRKQHNAVEEEVGVVKSGWLTMLTVTTKPRKYCVVLGDRALEFHDSEKMVKKKRHPKHIIDMSTCFNVHQHFEGKMKHCIAVMTPDETFLMKGDTDSLTDEWFDSLLSVLIPSRALHLGRPVLTAEFFECAWDVILVGQPKLKKPPQNMEELPNMCKKLPSLMGPHRLCFYPHTIIICKRSIEPASIKDIPKSGIPPFASKDFTELPRKYIANFGCQEKYFIMRMGRAFPSGSAEIWALCDNDEVALEIHNRLNRIIERESEKKRLIVNGATFCSTNSNNSLKGFRAYLRETKALVDSLERLEMAEQSCSGAEIAASHSLLTINEFPLSMGPTKSNIRSRSGIDRSFSVGSQLLSHSPNKISRAYSGSGSISDRKSDSLTNQQALIAEETEDSGDTIKDSNDGKCGNNSGETLAAINCQISSRSNSQLGGNSAAPTRSSDTSKLGLHDELQDEGALSFAGSTTDDCSSATPGDASEGLSNDNWDHLVMERCSCSSESTSQHASFPSEHLYNLEEVQSYVSDSSDSCYSSATPNSKRTYSLEQTMIHPKRLQSKLPASDNFGSVHMDKFQKGIPNRFGTEDDPRKRAFSLGSNSWLQKPLRKISRDIMSRAQRHFNVSASTLASSGASLSFRKSKSSTIHSIRAYIATDPCILCEDLLDNTLSNRSTSREMPSKVTDHISFDFNASQAAINRSGSGSMRSIDGSLDRSRTSLVGCTQNFVTSPGDPGEIAVHNPCHPATPERYLNSSKPGESANHSDASTSGENNQLGFNRPHELVDSGSRSNLKPMIDVHCASSTNFQDARQFVTILENLSSPSSCVSISSLNGSNGDGCKDSHCNGVMVNSTSEFSNYSVCGKEGGSSNKVGAKRSSEPVYTTQGKLARNSSPNACLIGEQWSQECSNSQRVAAADIPVQSFRLSDWNSSSYKCDSPNSNALPLTS